MDEWMQQFCDVTHELFFLELERKKLLNTDQAATYDARIEQLKQEQDDLLKTVDEGCVTEDEK